MNAKTATRRRRWPWIVAAGLIGVLLVAAIALPRLLDLERHRGRIEQALAEATGWDVALGSLDLSLMQGLALTVSPAKLSAPGGGSSIEVGRIAIRTEIMPLFRGELVVRSVELQRPAIEIVRPDAQSGWSLPRPGGSSGSSRPETETESGSSFSVRIDRIDVTDGSLLIEDRSVDPPLSLRIEGVSIAVAPVNGTIEGAGTLADDGGRIRWSGSVDEGLKIDLEQLRTEALRPWIGEELLHPGGLLTGQVSFELPATLNGHLEGRELRLLAGVRPIEQAELDFALAGVDGSWQLARLELSSGEARVTGSGFLLPLALELELQPTPVEAALDLIRAMVPLDVQVEGPGSASLTATVDSAGDEGLSYEARGRLSAARFAPGGVVPEVSDLRTAFYLSREGSLSLQVEHASIGGGPLTGQMRIDRLDPPGTLVFEGQLVDASIGGLLGGMIERAPEQLRGPATVRGKISVNLAAAELDASALSGQLSFGADRVSLAGWDLEESLRRKIRDELGVLAELAALASPDVAKALAADGGGGDRGERLLDRLAAEISFDGLPWSLQTLELKAGGVSARGSGSFDPGTGAVDLQLTAELDQRLTAEYLDRFSAIRPLVNEQGRLTLPLRLSGPLAGPDVDIELERLLADSLTQQDPKDLVRGLLKGLLDRKK